jgi:putative ABC transport system ATP-binding protein
MLQAMIQAHSLTKTIDTGTHRVDILRGIDLEIPRGQFAAIMGPSGSGKSTLLGLLAGLDTPTAGTISLDGQEITGLKEDELALVRGRKIGFVFQSYNLIPTLTAEENVLLPMELAGNGSGGGATRARELLDRVGWRTAAIIIRSSFPAASSSAWRWPARSWYVRRFCWPMSRPGNLDSENGRLVLDLLLSLNRQEGTTLVLVTHDQELANVADRRIQLRDGRIV